MLFYRTNQVFLKRYLASIILVFLMIVFLGLLSIFLGNSLIFVKTFKAFATEAKLSLILFVPILALHIVSFFDTQKAIKNLVIEDNYLSYELFNKQKEKILYTDIYSFLHTNDSFKNFEIKLKSGEKKIVYPTIKNKEEAFKLIQEKVKDANKEKTHPFNESKD